MVFHCSYCFCLQAENYVCVYIYIYVYMKKYTDMNSVYIS